MTSLKTIFLPPAPRASPNPNLFCHSNEIAGRVQTSIIRRIFTRGGASQARRWCGGGVKAWRGAPHEAVYLAIWRKKVFHYWDGSVQWHGGHFIFPSSSLSGILKRRDDVTYIAYVYIEAKSFYTSSAVSMHTWAVISKNEILCYKIICLQITAPLFKI